MSDPIAGGSSFPIYLSFKRGGMTGDVRIRFAETGKSSDSFVATGVEHYSRRISRYVDFAVVTLPGVKGGGSLNPEEVKRREGRQLLDLAEERWFLVLLDERGREFTSRDFASHINHIALNRSRKILFASGGAWGFSEMVYERSDMRLSLSKFTFPHQLVRVIFLEQLYRALTIISRHPYHNE